MAHPLEPIGGTDLLSYRRFKKYSIIFSILAALTGIGIMIYSFLRPNPSVITTTMTFSSSTTIDLGPLPEEPAPRTLADHIENYVDVPKGALNWKSFGKTEQIEVTAIDSGGKSFRYLQPRFTNEVRALDGKIVAIKGFMFPLDEGDRQGTFLFGPFPVNCPFHYHVGPSLVLEVHADEHPVPFTYDAITVRGKLVLLYDDKDNTLFYRLLNAQQIRN